jgi:hypothetical protein
MKQPARVPEDSASAANNWRMIAWGEGETTARIDTLDVDAPGEILVRLGAHDQ